MKKTRGKHKIEIVVPKSEAPDMDVPGLSDLFLSSLVTSQAIAEFWKLNLAKTAVLSGIKEVPSEWRVTIQY